MPSLVATFPIINDDGALKGMAIALINVKWIGDLAAAAAQHSGASVLLLDSRGTVIAGSADQQSFVGKQFADDPLTRQMLAADRNEKIPTEEQLRKIMAEADRVNVFGVGYKVDKNGQPIQVGLGADHAWTSNHFAALKKAESIGRERPGSYERELRRCWKLDPARMRAINAPEPERLGS